MSLSYTTGNPSNLTAGATASMTDISGPFADIKTFLTDGSAAVGDTILGSPTNGVWRTVHTSAIIMNGLTTTASYSSTNGIVASGGSSGTAQGLWVPPASADVAVAGKTTRLRLRVPYVVNATSAAITATWGLYPVSSSGGAASNISLTLGTVVAGSTAAAALAGANGVATGSSFDFSAVTSGSVYILGVVGSGSQAASSTVIAQPVLEIRHT